MAAADETQTRLEALIPRHDELACHGASDPAPVVPAAAPALIISALRDHSAVGKVVVAAARALTVFTVHKSADLAPFSEAAPLLLAALRLHDGALWLCASSAAACGPCVAGLM